MHSKINSPNLGKENKSYVYMETPPTEAKIIAMRPYHKATEYDTIQAQISALGQSVEILERLHLTNLK